MDTLQDIGYQRTCYSGSLYELVRRLQDIMPESITIPEEFAHAIRSAYVAIEGDCELLETVLRRVRETIERVDPDAHNAFKAILQGLLAIAESQRISLMWNEVSIKVGDPVSGKKISITIRGVPVEALIALKSVQS
ncbi:hypothetical protein [Pyrodictium abyssi]|uniref:Uncharacterized protein n=1 Tax=Pyrodictium abyssi TaxID=54256 RepID=A0ABM8IY36_9CREN|nr:hypothetical protein PABY_11090 [Pyrodictium abyssi]